MNWYLVYNLLLAHILSDFYFQTDKICEKKKESGFKGWDLYIHALCVLIISAFVCWDIKMIFPATIIATSHLIVDGFKAIVEMEASDNKKENTYGLFIFIIDQLIHITVILIIVWFFGKKWAELSFVENIKPQILWSILALIFLAKPVNILVDLLFKRYTISPISPDKKSEEKENDPDNFHSGKIIGTLERWLILILVMLSQYEAIGFLVAAKSILRFSETSKGNEKSEYVLVGTLFSFLIALLTGILILKLS